MRGLAIEVAGRLSVKNPAYVMPQLRRHLMQLLNDMDHSPDSLQREGARGPALRMVAGNVTGFCMTPWSVHT